MVRGRKPKPTAVKEANGSLRKHPDRRNHHEPQVAKGWPEMPEFVAVDDLAAKCWHSTCRLLDSMGLLTEADQHPVAAYCSDFAQWCTLREMVAGGSVGQMTQSGDKVRVEATQVHKYQDRMFKFWAEYGLTPSSRSRLIAKQADDDDDVMGELIASMRQG